MEYIPNERLKEIEEELSQLPEAFLVYKTIRGNRQPYLQWHEEGKTKSRYIRLDEREQILLEMDRKEELLRQKKLILTYNNRLQEAWKRYPSLHTQNHMTGKVGPGCQYFAELMEKHLFYVDKSMFIKAWWEDKSKVNLITRPRRFGKSLNMDMLDCFFSDRYRGRKDLFENLQIWECRQYRSFQGTYPVIHLDFSNMKSGRYESILARLTQAILREYYLHGLIESEDWSTTEHWDSDRIENELERLCRRLSEKSGKRIIILIDEYDTPIQEAWGETDYQKILRLMRMVFHCLLKANVYLEKALLTGITRISRESLFSDLNNLRVSTVSSSAYAEYFGFTEEEVYASLDSQDIGEHEKVKEWYDGFRIGDAHGIYNPWSITNYLLERKFDTYWANTSSNSMIGTLLNRSSLSLKKDFLRLLNGESIEITLKENIIWEDLEREESLVWGLLLATGYITGNCTDSDRDIYRVHVTNKEVMGIFDELFLRWFSGNSHGDYEAFLRAMFAGDTCTMTEALNEIMLETFSFFDVSGSTENRKTENFYHGFVLGLVAALRSEYRITSNRESGYGRYDCILEPREAGGKAIVLEFKVCSKGKSESLAESAENALMQIKKRAYTAVLTAHGISEDDILCYGIAFRGKECAISSK